MSQLSRRAAAIAFVAVTAAGCSPSAPPISESPTPPPATSAAPSSAAPSSASAMAAHGVEARVGDIPWTEVGAGWMLATWSPVEGNNGEPPEGEPTPENSATSLYLVNPAGGRYLITTFPPSGNGVNPYLVDWSGDGGRALFYSVDDESGKATEVDLHTGDQKTFTVDQGFAITPRYTRPEGKAVLLAKGPTENAPETLERVSLDGKHQLSYPADQLGSRFTGEYLSAPDGTHLVLGTDSGLAVVGNDGKVGRVLPIDGATWCQPSRWWDDDATVAIANCNAGDDGGSRLWLVPVDGAAPTALTAVMSGSMEGPVLGAETAWQLPAGNFVQAYGPCGLRLLAKLDSLGAMPQEIHVPKVDGNSSVNVIGTHDGHLDLQASVSCGTGQSLLDYDPAADASTVLLGGDVNGGGVINALAYPGHE